MSVQNSRIRRALLASGSVVGITAVATLALWSDSEFSLGQFTAAASNKPFTVESFDSASNSWSSHPSKVAALNINVPIGGQKTFLPLDRREVTQEFKVRMASNHTGKFRLLEPSTDASDISFAQRINVKIASGSCDQMPTTFLYEGSLVGFGGAVVFGEGLGPGEEGTVCFRLALGDLSGMVPGVYNTGRIYWPIAAQEKEI